MHWELVGHFGVDAGICWIGDPCYIIHTDDQPKAIGKNWREFCDILGESYPIKKSFRYDMGHEGLGVCVSTGWGDGTYPVYALINEHNRISQVLIDFEGIFEEGEGGRA